jgi:hypothetical protein
MAAIAAPLEEARAGSLARPVGVLTTVAVSAVATAVTVCAVQGSTVLRDPEVTAIVRGLFVASHVGLGAVTWWRRPDSRLGPLLAGTGFLYALTSLSP